ncbi:MAG: serine/threonine-protein kinase [Myxococcota bacterium]|nr:serine/threonine-protein kinase [Myxococcota bacterium]
MNDPRSPARRPPGPGAATPAAGRAPAPERAGSPDRTDLSAEEEDDGQDAPTALMTGLPAALLAELDGPAPPPPGRPSQPAGVELVPARRVVRVGAAAKVTLHQPPPSPAATPAPAEPDDEPDEDEAPPRPPAVPRSWCAGDLLHGRYLLERVLGRGGMGEVILARDLFLQEPVALKTLRGLHDDDPEQLESLRAEVAAAHGVSHPGLARTYDLGQGEGIWYVSMEFLEGESLAARIAREGGLPLPDVRRLGMEVALAMHAAHQAGIIHRDLKPANIQLTPQRGAVVMDFGLATSTSTGAGPKGRGPAGEGQDSGASSRATSGGTPRYMAPEQWREEPQGPATDIWAFGIILYEMLTGRTPFVELTDRASLMMAHIEKPVPPMRTFRKDTPRKLEKLVAACLQKDPARRPASMLEIARELAVTPARHHLVTGLLALGLVLLFTVAGLTLWSTVRGIILREMRPAVERLAIIAASQLDGADLDAVHTPADMEKEEFTRVHKTLNKIKKMDPAVRWVYTWRKLPAKHAWEEIVDANPWDEDRNENGTIESDERGSKPADPFDDNHLPGLREVFEHGRPGAEPDLYEDSWGIFLTGYSPVPTPSGDFSVVAVDVGHEPLILLGRILQGVFVALGLASLLGLLWLRRRAALARLLFPER